MRSASVGFQCPDDVAAGAKQVRQPRTVFGGAVTGDTSRVSLGLVVVNVAVFFVGLALGDGEVRARFAHIPGFPGAFGIADGEYYRLGTAAFLHGGVFHLAMNMFALATVGPVLESSLGRVRFGLLYALSALGGSTLGFLLAPLGQASVGASGAIFGLFGAYYVVVRRMGGETRSITMLLAINLVITFVIPIIDWRAHLGGLVTGALVAVALAYAPRTPRRSTIQFGACGAVAVLLVVLVALRQAALSG